MVERIIIPERSDNEDRIGEELHEDEFNIRIRKDADVYLCNDDNRLRLLFSYRRHAIKDATTWFKTLNECFDTPILASDRRFRAAGSEKKRVLVRSGIIGFYDRLTPQHKIQLGVHGAGRTTAFVRHYPDRWKRCVPFFQTISELYHQYCPQFFKIQKKFIQKIEPALRISKTVFTTATVNQNWSTHVHTDRGDFPHGMSCMAVLGKDYRGGWLGFPRRGILVEIGPGDLIMMDSHEPHGNTPIRFTADDGKRLSLVCYVRTDLEKYHERVETKSGQIFFIKSSGN